MVASIKASNAIVNCRWQFQFNTAFLNVTRFDRIGRQRQLFKNILYWADIEKSQNLSKRRLISLDDTVASDGLLTFSE
jgi:hypothetical protein